MSPEMEAAVQAFEIDCPHGCSVQRQANPIYILITVDGWPRAVHYEFRDRVGDREYYVEFHIEDPKYSPVKDTLKMIVADIGEINGLRLNYFESRLWPHRKKLPSASIAIPKNSDGAKAAAAMRSLIAATREPLTLALERCVVS